MSQHTPEQEEEQGFFNPEDRSPEGLRRDWWVYLTIPFSVWAAYHLLDSRMPEYPGWWRAGAGTIAALLTWWIMKISGFVRRVEIDPVLSGAFAVFLAAMLGVQAPFHLNRTINPEDHSQTMELPVLGDIENHAFVAPSGRNFGASGLHIVSVSPFPPHQKFLIPIKDAHGALYWRCVTAVIHPGRLGVPWAKLAKPKLCSSARGKPGRQIKWEKGAFAYWRWVPGSSSEESP